MYSLFFFHFENEIKVNSDKINLMTLKKTIGLYNRIRNEECTELLKTIIAASLSILNEFKWNSLMRVFWIMINSQFASDR